MFVIITSRMDVVGTFPSQEEAIQHAKDNKMARFLVRPILICA